MWNLYDKAKRANKLPSECVPGLDAVACDWTIWQFDNAVHFVGSVLEHALNERVETGEGKNYRSQPKYKLSQLLEDDFRLPRPLTAKQERKQVGEQLKAMFGMGARRPGRPKAQGQGQSKPLLPPSLAKQWLARGRTL